MAETEKAMTRDALSQEEIETNLNQMLERLQFFINKCISEGNSDVGCDTIGEDCHVKNCKACCDKNTNGNSACLSKCEILEWTDFPNFYYFQVFGVM